MEKDVEKILDSLSPNERKVLPNLEEPTVSDICQKSNLDKVSVLRALEYLKNKNLIEINVEEKKIIELGLNGALYKKKGLPERRLLNLLNEKRILKLEDIPKQSDLSEDELKVSIGILKRRSLIDLKKGKIIFNANKEEIAKKSPEELFLDSLPINYDDLNKEQEDLLKILNKRKEIIHIEEKKTVDIEVTGTGKKMMEANLKGKKLIEQITPEILKKESLWKGRKFRRYDVTMPVPHLNGGKRHFVNQAIEYAKRIWTEMGFEELTGKKVESSFWVFDALFTAQDHPVREMQDTFFIDKKEDLPGIEVVNKVKNCHEKGVDGSKGWQYSWDDEEAKKLVLRTHTTCLSARKLYELSKLPENERKGKFFALEKCFRNETVDWSHGFEFYQSEGIVVDENVNFRHLLGYLEKFYKKMGFEKVRFRPSYFPYTEPSVEVDAWHKEKGVWLEVGGAGIFRPEITIPLLGKKTPVLAWGQGFDRIIMDYYKIKDLRELYKNNLTKSRKMKYWMK